jgi:thiamine-phosphate pyrophosphorylase
MPAKLNATELLAPARVRRGLYAVTPGLDDTEDLVVLVDSVLAGGAAMLQYRNKNASAGLRQAQATALAERCRRAGVPLIINDDPRLASAVGADGVHLGRDDGSVAEARAILRGGIVGVSCYDDFTLAERAVAAGADYIAFGSFFPSVTKPGAARAGLELLARATALRPRPAVVAIGGITPENAGALVKAGCDLLAVIQSLFGAPDPAAVANDFRRLYDHA